MPGVKPKPFRGWGLLHHENTPHPHLGVEIYHLRCHAIEAYEERVGIGMYGQRRREGRVRAVKVRLELDE